MFWNKCASEDTPQSCARTVPHESDPARSQGALRRTSVNAPSCCRAMPNQTRRSALWSSRLCEFCG
eukprot:3938494-Rhodomonas_salina.2